MGARTKSLTSLASLLLLLSGAASAAELKPCGGPYGSFNPGTDKRLPNHGRPSAKVAFPQIENWDSLVMTLSRSECYGTCPAYSVSIHGDGKVEFHGESNVASPGDRRSSISHEDIQRLYEKFRAVDYFWLFDDYHSAITDLPSETTSISFDGHNKSVSDYVGVLVGMPEEVMDLENEIDKIAGTDRWTCKRDE